VKVLSGFCSHLFLPELFELLVVSYKSFEDFYNTIVLRHITLYLQLLDSVVIFYHRFTESALSFTKFEIKMNTEDVNIFYDIFFYIFEI